MHGSTKLKYTFSIICLSMEMTTWRKCEMKTSSSELLLFIWRRHYCSAHFKNIPVCTSDTYSCYLYHNTPKHICKIFSALNSSAWRVYKVHTLMVILVPPSQGPSWGSKSVTSGFGQVWLRLSQTPAPWSHWSFTSQRSDTWHQPQPYFSASARHMPQLSAMSRQR